MKISGVSHIGIGVQDLEKSEHFYNKILGLPIVHRMEYDETPHILRYPERLFRRAIYVKVGVGDAAVVLVIGTIDKENDKAAILLDELGLHHFAFWVDDIHDLHRRLRDNGIEVLMDPVDCAQYHVDQSDTRAGGPCATMFFRDPDGIMLQADQRLNMRES